MPANDNREQVLQQMETEEEMVAAILDQSRRLREMLDAATETVRRLQAKRS